MFRALELARLGLGNVSPNPMVGCVIVCDNRIIGEGFHQQFGQAHAEVNAINSVSDKSLLSKSTLYVTLEPCCHFGKTPPCADLIIKHKIQNVIVCNPDPNALVAGKGISKLEAAGIRVISNVLAAEGNELNKRFFAFHTKHRPYILLKWAQTQDKFVAKQNFDSKWISNPYARQQVHQMRANEDAILVGFNTAFYDNPSLTVRDAAGKNPIRVLLDPNLEIPETHFIYNTEAKTLVLNQIKSAENQHIHFINCGQSAENIIEVLYQQNIQSVIIEGGSATLQKFINANLWDEAHVFESETIFGQGIKAPITTQKMLLETNLMGDKWMKYKNDLL